MSFWQRFKQALRSFMEGRNGADHLSMALLWLGLISYLLGSILGAVNVAVVSLLGFLLSILGLAAYILCIFRIFSRNRDKRAAENRRYLNWSQKRRTAMKQARMRFKNRKKYKYFRCPGCRAWLRLPRGTGMVTVTCSRCHNSFTQKS